MNCCCLHPRGDLLVGNTTGVHLMNIDGVLQSFSFLGKKRYVMMIKDSVLVGSFDENGQQVVSIYNLDNRVIEYSLTLFRSGKAEYIAFVVNIWGVILIITRNRSVFSLKEKDLQTKLNSLFEKHKYRIALSIAQNQQLDLNGIMDIHRM